MYRAAFALCGDRELAQDATQEAFARALSRWRRLRGERWAAGWVMTTALNVARRSLRRRAPTPQPVEASPRADLDLLLDVRGAVRALPRRQQTAVVLYYLAGLPVPEVAGAMGCREGTVRAHLAKARASLARDLGDPRLRPVPAQEKGDGDG
ncbi:MAG: sigma-70 family RNA polymerase sigma factor [Actinomycetota bacterium]|nr:sigma-70 family RNA polymerase sigma factor [Actinomycetota bacterium]